MLLLCPSGGTAQHSNSLTATLDDETNTINIQQEFVYQNSSKDTLNTLYFNDWAHAYSDKNTALAKRFGEEFKKSLHLAKDEERGSTEIFSIVDNEYRGLVWKRTTGQDIVQITLNNTLPPGEEAKLFITYTVKLPSTKFTPYGYNNRKGYYLKDWYLTPAVYDGSWQLYSNKNLEDLYTDIANTNIHLIFPDSLNIGTNYNEVNVTSFPGKQYASLKGENRKSCEIILNPNNRFIKHVTGHSIVVTDIRSNNYPSFLQGISIDKITKFIHENLGDFPYEQLLVSEADFNKNPFIWPESVTFLYKTI